MPSEKLYAFVLPDNLRAALKALKKRDGGGESEIIRRALRAWLMRKGVLERSVPGQRKRTPRSTKKSAPEAGDGSTP